MWQQQGDNGEIYGNRYRCGRDSKKPALLSAGMESASDVDTDVGAGIMLRGVCGVMGLIHCSLCLRNVSNNGQWRQIWDTSYENAAIPGKKRVLTLLQAHMVPVPDWTRLIMIIACNILKVCM